MDIARLGIAVETVGPKKAAAELQNLTGAAARAENQMDTLHSTSGVVSTSMTSTSAAVRANSAALQINAKAARAASFQQKNLVFQLNDVFVSLASGMNPMMVAIQQGSQIGQIYGPNEGGIGRAFKETGRLIVGVLTKFPLVTAAVGLAGAVFAGLAFEINKGRKNTVSLGNVFLATVSVIAGRIYSVLQPAILAISPWFAAVWNAVKTSTKFVINLIVGGMVGAAAAIRAAWADLPNAFGFIGFAIANSFLKGIENMVKSAIDGVNQIVDYMNQIPGVDMGKLDSSGITGSLQLDNPFSGKAVGKSVGSAFKKALGQDFVGDLFNDIEAEAIKRQAKTDAKKDKGKKGKSDAQKLADRYSAIVRDQKQYIAGLELEKSLLGQSAMERERMTVEAKLINKLEDAGIKLTAERAKEIANLAEQSAQVKFGLARAKAEMEGMKQVGSDLGGIFKGLLDNTLSWKDAAFQAVQSLLKYLNQVNVAGGGKGILGGGFLQSFIGGALGITFDGGGHTGPGARSGGVDGRGGFPAILHPNETVIDHTKGQSAANNNVIITGSIMVSSDDEKFTAQMTQISASTVRAATPAIVDQSVAKSGSALGSGKFDKSMTRFSSKPMVVAR